MFGVSLDRFDQVWNEVVAPLFSTNFRHYPGEVRRRTWVVHRDHYDRFFTQDDLVRLFEPAFAIEAIIEEIDGHEAFHHALLVKEPV